MWGGGHGGCQGRLAVASVVKVLGAVLVKLESGSFSEHSRGEGVPTLGGGVGCGPLKSWGAGPGEPCLRARGECV